MAGSDAKRKTYLIQDPYDPYAIEFITTIFTYFGLRPVCIHTDAKGRYYGEREYPMLKSTMVEASYDADLNDLTGLARRIDERYDVVGVVPWGEVQVAPAAELCALLGIEWNDPEVLARFRDKHALKEYVGKVAPDVRVPMHRLVRSAADLDGDLPERFVLKPNDGYGNMSVGVFASTDLDGARAHIAAGPGVTWILEEFIGGVEYHVDGQVRETGEVVALGVFEYLRAEVNGYPTVYFGEVQCTTDDPVFDELIEYARRLLTATGLRRCPFHLELKIDDRGPCVVDLGARFPSDGAAPLLGRLHPYRPDPFAVAASDYLGGSLLAEDVIDWTHYDSARVCILYGISEEAGLIHAIRGLDDVAAMPEFVTWIFTPKVGDRLPVTKELRDTPYIGELACAGSREESFALIERGARTDRDRTRGRTAEPGRCPRPQSVASGTRQGGLARTSVGRCRRANSDSILTGLCERSYARARRST